MYHSLLSYVLDKLDANDDSLDYKTMKETLEYSGMDLAKMREQVEGCHSQEDETKTKIQWMDRLVQSIISIENLPGSKVGVFSRGLIREFVELAWIYCEKFCPTFRTSHKDQDLKDYKRKRSSSPHRRSKSPLFITIPASTGSEEPNDQDYQNRNSTLVDKNSNYTSTEACPDMANYLQDSLVKLGINEKQVHD